MEGWVVRGWIEHFNPMSLIPLWNRLRRVNGRCLKRNFEIFYIKNKMDSKESDFFENFDRKYRELFRYI